MSYQFFRKQRVRNVLEGLIIRLIPFMLSIAVYFKAIFLFKKVRLKSTLQPS